MTAPPIAWRPDAELLRESNVARFMQSLGIRDFADLVDRSINEPEWFWESMVRFLDLPFDGPLAPVLDVSDGIAWA